MEVLNIIELIEKNPITNLSGTYNNKLFTLIKEIFTETQQQLFVIQEESNELKLQLEQKEQQLENHIVITQLEKELLREKTILEQFPKNTPCVYYGFIDDTNDKNEKFVKFGNSNLLCDRVKTHKHNFTNFRLVNAFRVDNQLHIENEMKTHAILCKKRQSMVINGLNQTELFVIDDLSLETLDDIIKDIITRIEYNPENYVKLLDEYTKLKKAHVILSHKQNTSNQVESITSLRGAPSTTTEMNKKYKCNYCNKSYSNYNSLWTHNKSFHNGIKPEITVVEEKPKIDLTITKYSCRVCNKNYKHKQTRFKHEKTCNGIKQSN